MDGMMGLGSGYGCKKTYRFPHITYPYILLLCMLFLQYHDISTFCSLKNFLYSLRCSKYC